MAEMLLDTAVEDGFAFQNSSPQSLRQAHPSPGSRFTSNTDHNYNFSSAVYDETTDVPPSTDEEDGYGFDEHALLYPVSTRASSISSFPASVIHTLPSYVEETPRTPSKYSLSHGNERTTTPTYSSPRVRSTGFRNPSSVRALQMRDEYGQSEYEELTPHRRQDSRISYFSHRSSFGSAHSSPTKRTSKNNTPSPQKSATKSRLRKEFPLVLLHCTILPPPLTTGTPPKLGDSVWEAIIPQPYGKRWKMLQEKTVRNTEVKTRGVLIPHPRDEYELLEEKLLESLELERPRLREGHFLSDGRVSAIDSGFESASSSDRADGHEVTSLERKQKASCPDCGRCVGTDVEAEKKWEIKVYAANGLMRAGAWGAAWQEMEKVDVEVSVWMPEDVRRELDSRVEALVEQEKTEKAVRKQKRKQMDDERMREIYGSELLEPAIDDQEKSQEEIDGLFDTREQDPASNDMKVRDKEQQQQQSQRAERVESAQNCSTDTQLFSGGTLLTENVSLQDVLTNYIRLLAQDRRNITIVLLSIIVLFYAMVKSTTQSPLSVDYKMMESVVGSVPSFEVEVAVVTSTFVSTSTNTEMVTTTSIAVATSITTSTMTSTAVETSTVVETVTSPLSSMESVIFETPNMKPAGVERANVVSEDILLSLEMPRHQSQIVDPFMNILDEFTKEAGKTTPAMSSALPSYLEMVFSEHSSLITGPNSSMCEREPEHEDKNESQDEKDDVYSDERASKHEHEIGLQVSMEDARKSMLYSGEEVDVDSVSENQDV